MNSKVTIEILKKYTDDFLKKHWNSEAFNEKAPTWNARWFFKGTMKGHDKQGCYALLSNDEVIYIGVGASKGTGIYKGHGIGARTGKYSRVAPSGRKIPCPERPYIPTKKWKERNLTAIMTVGFPEEYGYLAYALEAYLLKHIETKFNQNGQ